MSVEEKVALDYLNKDKYRKYITAYRLMKNDHAVTINNIKKHIDAGVNVSEAITKYLKELSRDNVFKRETIIQLGIEYSATVEDVNKWLNVTGHYGLYCRNVQDSIVIYSLINGLPFPEYEKLAAKYQKGSEGEFNAPFKNGRKIYWKDICEYIKNMSDSEKNMYEFGATLKITADIENVFFEIHNESQLKNHIEKLRSEEIPYQRKSMFYFYKIIYRMICRQIDNYKKQLTEYQSAKTNIISDDKLKEKRNKVNSAYANILLKGKSDITKAGSLNNPISDEYFNDSWLSIEELYKRMASFYFMYNELPPLFYLLDEILDIDMDNSEVIENLKSFLSDCTDMERKTILNAIDEKGKISEFTDSLYLEIYNVYLKWENKACEESVDRQTPVTRLCEIMEGKSSPTREYLLFFMLFAGESEAYMNNVLDNSGFSRIDVNDSFDCIIHEAINSGKRRSFICSVLELIYEKSITESPIYRLTSAKMRL